MGLLLFTDTETNDLRSKAMEKEPAHAEGQPRIASLAYILCDEDSGTVLANYYAMVYPDGWTMSAGAYAANGLEMDMLKRRGLPIVGVIASMADVLSLGKREPLTLVAHGLQFDYKNIRGELRRHEMPDFYETTKRYCTMFSSTKQVGLKQEGTNRPKWPNLAETYQHYFNKGFGGLHNAFQDTFACKAIYFEKRKRGEDMTPKEPDGYAIVEPNAPMTKSASSQGPAEGEGAARQPSDVPPSQPVDHGAPAASASLPTPPNDEDLI